MTSLHDQTHQMDDRQHRHLWITTGTLWADLHYTLYRQSHMERLWPFFLSELTWTASSPSVPLLTISLLVVRWDTLYGRLWFALKKEKKDNSVVASRLVLKYLGHNIYRAVHLALILQNKTSLQGRMGYFFFLNSVKGLFQWSLVQAIEQNKLEGRRDLSREQGVS